MALSPYVSAGQTGFLQVASNGPPYLSNTISNSIFVAFFFFFFFFLFSVKKKLPQGCHFKKLGCRSKDSRTGLSIFSFFIYSYSATTRFGLLNFGSKFYYFYTATTEVTLG